jgi:hypothetical protein
VLESSLEMSGEVSIFRYSFLVCIFFAFSARVTFSMQLKTLFFRREQEVRLLFIFFLTLASIKQDRLSFVMLNLILGPELSFLFPPRHGDVSLRPFLYPLPFPFIVCLKYNVIDY